MARITFAVLLLITLVSIASAGAGFKKKLFKQYAMGNLWAKCIGQEHFDKFVVQMINAGKKCYSREFDASLKPLYIRPYPAPTNEVEEKEPMNQQPFGQPPQYQQAPQYVQPPMYQQYRQPQYGYQQPQFGFQQPQFNFQPQYQGGRFNSRQKRQTKPVAGEAEQYYYNKLEKMMKSKVGNMSCIMHELGYFTADNEVNIEKYREEYNKLTTVPDAMKEEFLEVVDVCQEIAQCIPERALAKYPYGLEYGRAFLFVMCEKKKASAVCLKKQMIDDYYKYKDLFASDDDMGDMDDGGDLFSMDF